MKRVGHHATDGKSEHMSQEYTVVERVVFVKDVLYQGERRQMCLVLRCCRCNVSSVCFAGEVEMAALQRLLLRVRRGYQGGALGRYGSLDGRGGLIRPPCPMQQYGHEIEKFHRRQVVPTVKERTPKPRPESSAGFEQLKESPIFKNDHRLRDYQLHGETGHWFLQPP